MADAFEADYAHAHCTSDRGDHDSNGRHSLVTNLTTDCQRQVARPAVSELGWGMAKAKGGEGVRRESASAEQREGIPGPRTPAEPARTPCAAAPLLARTPSGAGLPRPAGSPEPARQSAVSAAQAVGGRWAEGTGVCGIAGGRPCR